MSKSNIYTLNFRRKRRGETDYRKRLKILLSNKLRLVVRKSLNNIVVQIVEYYNKGDKVILAVSSKVLDKFDWKTNKGNLPSAYLTGLLIGTKAKKKGITELVMDIGLNKSVKGSRTFAVLKGVIDAGIKVPHSDEILPNEDRIKGTHIAKYAEISKKNGNYEKIFSDYIKQKIDPSQISEYFEKSKKKIMGAN
tara:strand:- start:978 stop:1559 length:582 start_codon:yes stop_codon:yes gene_type:complete